MAKLGEVCYKESSNIAQKDLENHNGIYPIFGASGLIKYVDFYQQENPYIAVVKDGSVGKIMKLPAKSSVIGTMQYILPKPNINLSFLAYAMENMNLAKYKTGAIIPHIYFKDYQKEEIPLPPLEEQQKIAAVLDKVTDLIDKRKQQLAKLDELIKSRFVEMFGTLEKPVKKFNYDILQNLCKKITDGKHGGCSLQIGSKRYFVGAKEINNNKINYETAPEININEFEKDYKRCNVEIGDFLLVNTGATIGKSVIASDIRTKYTLLQKSVALFKVKQEFLNATFLKYCYAINKKMYKVNSASAQPNLLLSKIKTTLIYVPPLDLQNQFAEFVEQTEKTKVAINHSLDKLETLKKALMQKYFG